MSTSLRHQAADKLAADIVRDWRGPQSAFFVVVPPLNHSTVLFDRLSQPAVWLHADAPTLDDVAIAHCPPTAYANEGELVAHILREWKIEMTLREFEDDLDLLGRAVRELSERETPLRPVLLLPRFADKAKQLSQEFGGSLQEFYRQRRLMLVVEIPLYWLTLVERERNRGNPNFMNSDFGQGFSTQHLAGLTRKEVAAELDETNESSSLTEAVYELTGGLPDLVSLSASANRRGVQRNELETMLADSSGRFFEYLDPPTGSGLRDALARLFLGIPDESDQPAFERHEWRNVIFNPAPDWSLRCRVLGYEAARTFSLHRRQQNKTDEIERQVASLVQRGSYAAARTLVEQCDPSATSRSLRGLFHIATILEIARSGLDEWRHALTHLEALDSLLRQGGSAAPKGLTEWRDFANKIAVCIKAGRGQNPDLIELLCAREARPDGPRIALRLIASRLAWAEQIVEPLFATTAMITAPEALVQLYCAAKLDLNFWAPPPLDAAHLEMIRSLPQKKGFEWPPQDRPMLFGQLLALSWPRQFALPPNERLAPDYLELEKLQHLYTQQRVPLVHSLTMLSRKQWNNFPKRCRDLLANVARAVMPDASLHSLPLPPLETIHIALAEPAAPLQAHGRPVSLPGTSVTNAASPPAATDAALKLDAEPLKAAFVLNHLLLHRQLNGGLSGSRVDLIEFHAGADVGDLEVGILKSTRRTEDFERECAGTELARQSWLKTAMPSEPRYHTSGGIHYILAPLAFPAHTRRDVPSLHELVVGRSTMIVRATAKSLGDLYARGLEASHYESGTPREHLVRIWEPWAKRAAAFDWTRFKFPSQNDPFYLDQLGVRPNPLAALIRDDLWMAHRNHAISFRWCLQHGDLNAKNVLVGEDAGGLINEVRLIDFEKIRDSSSFLDVCWVSLWCLMASAGSAPIIDPRHWEKLPDALVKEIFRELRPLPTRRDNDLDPFEPGLQCVRELFATLFGEGRKPAHLAPSQDMLALTLGATALAKSFYTLRDIERCESEGRDPEPHSRDWAVAFFRISTRALADFEFVTVDPRATPSVNLCHALLT